jgi:hypothetical protein
MFQFTGFATGGGGGGFGLGSGITTGAIVSPRAAFADEAYGTSLWFGFGRWIRFFAVNSGNEYASGNGRFLFGQGRCQIRAG